MHKITHVIMLAGLVFANPESAKIHTHHHPVRPVHHRRHHTPRAGRPGRTHVPVRRSPGAPTVTLSESPAQLSPLPPVQMIGIGNPPGCLNGADPTPYLRHYGATVVRIVLSPYYGALGTDGQAIPCLKAATAAGARVEIAIQWRSIWTPVQAADFVRRELGFYGPYVWAVGLGNEQELPQTVPGQPVDAPQTPEQYAKDFQAAAQIVASAAPGAIRVALEVTPWSLTFSQQAFADGLPGAQALAVHAYSVPAGQPTLRDFYNLATSYRLPLWCTEGLDEPGAWVKPRYPPQPLARLGGCQLAVAWLN